MEEEGRAEGMTKAGEDGIVGGEAEEGRGGR